MLRIISFAVTLILTIATSGFADDNPFETMGGKFKLFPCKDCTTKPFYIEFNDGGFSIVNGPKGYYSFENNIVKIIREDQSGEKIIIHGRITVNEPDFIRVEDGKNVFDFYRYGEKIFGSAERSSLASRELE